MTQFVLLFIELLYSDSGNLMAVYNQLFYVAELNSRMVTPVHLNQEVDSALMLAILLIGFQMYF